MSRYIIENNLQTQRELKGLIMRIIALMKLNSTDWVFTR